MPTRRCAAVFTRRIAIFRAAALGQCEAKASLRGYDDRARFAQAVESVALDCVARPRLQIISSGFLRRGEGKDCSSVASASPSRETSAAARLARTGSAVEAFGIETRPGLPSS